MKSLKEREFKFIQKSKKIHENKYDYSEINYINAHTKVKIICPEHGVFEQTPDSHSRKHGCPKCNGGVNSDKESFIKRAKEKHGDLYNYSLIEYVNNNVKVKIICSEHGIFEQRPNDHIYYGCLICGFKSRAISKTMTNESFIKKAKEKHGNLYDYSNVNYVKSSEKIEVICRTHGKFYQKPNSHLNGSGCPLCKESYGEKIIRNYLVNNNINFIPQKRFSDCKDKRPLPFDFYIPKLNLCIEYDGIQHFKECYFNKSNEDFIKIKIRDEIKNNYCNKPNKPKLMRISYKDFKKIESLLNNIFISSFG